MAAPAQQADAAARTDNEVLRFFYRRSDAPANWHLWAEPGPPKIDQLVRQKQLTGVGAPQAAERTPQGNGVVWVGVKAPAKAIIERAPGGDRHPVTLNKAYRIDLDAVAAAWKLTPSGWRRMPWRSR